MSSRQLTVSGVVALVAAIALAGSTLQAVDAQAQSQTKLSGVIHDHVEAGWQLNGAWSVHVKRDSGTADFFASLTMLRSDLWVLLTGADPTDPSLRTPHTHHVALLDGTLTVIDNGWRISGAAVITGNGDAAGYSPSPIDVEITGGNALPSTNVKLEFNAPAADHFGEQPLEGVVTVGR